MIYRRCLQWDLKNHRVLESKIRKYMYVVRCVCVVDSLAVRVCELNFWYRHLQYWGNSLYGATFIYKKNTPGKFYFHAWIKSLN